MLTVTVVVVTVFASLFYYKIVEHLEGISTNTKMVNDSVDRCAIQLKGIKDKLPERDIVKEYLESKGWELVEIKAGGVKVWRDPKGNYHHPPVDLVPKASAEAE